MDEILKRTLDFLKGPEFWVCAVLIVIGVVVWRLIGAATAGDRKTLLWQSAVSAVIGLLALGFVLLHRFYLSRQVAFSDGVTGILVTGIVGDDSAGSLQADLIGHLNAELQKEPTEPAIEVHGCADTVDENIGLAGAHERARALGKKWNARLVIWGRRIGDKQFFPRITVVAAPENWAATRERTLFLIDITDLRLPTELVDEPLYLIRFAAGYSCYINKQFAKALLHFRAALRRKGPSPPELADLKFQTAVCLLAIGDFRKSMTADLGESIGLLDSAADTYKETDRNKWAMVQSNRAAAYVDLPGGKKSDNCMKAIAACEAALSLHTETLSPKDWAVDQINLGSAYRELRVGNRRQNLEKAIAATTAATRVFTEQVFPSSWAEAQINIGLAHRNLAEAINDAGPLKDALVAYSAALRVFTEKKYPYKWALTELHIGNASITIPSNKEVVLEVAIRAFEGSLRVLNEKDYPFDWAVAEVGLGTAYGTRIVGDPKDNQEKAIMAYESALRMFTEAGYPIEWAGTQTNLGSLYAARISGDHATNLRAAAAFYKAALRVYSNQDFAEYFRDVSNSLASVETELRQISSKKQLR